MPHQIFFVEELVMLITKEVIEYSYEDAICLALTCRALESPALSVLWATQTTLSTLIRVLPQDTLAYTSLGECPQETRHSLEELVRNFNFPSVCVPRVQPRARIS